MSETKHCNRIFERIYTGEIVDQVTFKSDDHGVFAVLALKQATRGHTLIVPTECVPRVDYVSPESRRIVGIVERAAGLWLQAAFEPRYVGELTAGVEVPHAHRHRIPCYEGRDWLEVMGHADPKPFVGMSKNEAEEVYLRATFHPEFAAVVEAELGGDEFSFSELEAMAYDLAIPRK